MIFRLRIFKPKMKRFLIIVLFPLFITACQSGGNASKPPIPAACDLLPTSLLGEILREPVKKPTPTNAGLQEISACTYTLPGRGREDYLGIYVFSPAPTRDMLSLKTVADDWRDINAGAKYEIQDNAQYPMAWFPGENKVYPSTFIILYDRATIVVTGVSLDDSKSIAFRAMVQYKLDESF